jgi:hypothetical protein
MPLLTCECVAGLPPQQQLANIYCALYTLAQGGGGGGVTYPLSPTLGGTGVANAAGETITLNGGFALQFTLTGATNVTLPTSGTIQVFNQALNTTDGVTFFSVTGDFFSGGNSLDATGFNGLAITNNGGSTLNIGGGLTLAITGADMTLAGAQATSYDSTSSTAPASNVLGGLPAACYGDGTNFLMGEPVQWMTVNIGGTNFRTPLYLA